MILDLVDASLLPSSIELKALAIAIGGFHFLAMAGETQPDRDDGDDPTKRKEDEIPGRTEQFSLVIY
ncbi:hypothetical protein OVA26_16315 [Microbacterium sp. SL62]|uniref:hypothetical protein n=1 Tax=Microbacterium sp. SL62 TaxID=2995139 RepID=UPI0022742EB4|nr:hypothetical protein [Microbacterium sp. SL62]MCY1718501.1 hypothetical protein [Microbacterium sp. SL62]